MATQTTPARKKRKIGRRRIERVQHVIEIEDWRWEYMFGLDETSFREGPYFDYRHLEIKGKLLRPTSINAATAEVTCFPNYRLSESGDRSKHQPKNVGAISHRGKEYSANLHIPADVLGPLLQMMIAGKYRFIVIEAEKSFRGEALIRNFRFSVTVTDEDLSSE
jgi:hypothetical protein